MYDPAPAAAAAPAPVMRLPAQRDVVQDDEHSEVDDNGLLQWSETDWIDFSEAVVAWCRVQVCGAARSTGLDRVTTDRLLRDVTGDNLRHDIPF